MNRLYLDLHAIQTLPPSNINRDDTGSPKTAQYGGVRRARVSSQSWKRSIREYFNENGYKSNVGIRTKHIVSYVAGKIREMDQEIDLEKSMDMADKVINAAGVKTSDQKAKALFFLGDEQAKSLAKAAIDGQKDKKTLQALLKQNPAIDIALFGRMVADDPSLNEDASSQFAHSISTHAVQTEFDFYTAVDDSAPEDNAGAGMLGTIEFNSSTLYRYANVSVHQLLNQLKDKQATINAIKLLIEAFTNSLPTGKVNTFANQTLPQAILVTLRTDRPVNLVSAFEVPVKSNDGYVDKSINKLLEEFEKVETFVEKPVKSLYLSTENVEIKDTITKENSLRSLIEDIGEIIAEKVEDLEIEEK